jgi:hypothetical protein
MLRADQEHAEASQDVFAAIDDAFLPALFRAVVGQRSGAGESRAKPRHEGGGGARRSCRSQHSLGSRRSFHLCPRGRLLLPVTLRLLEVAA